MGLFDFLRKTEQTEQKTVTEGEPTEKYLGDLTKTDSVQRSLFGIASRYVEARSKALPCIFKYTMKSRSFSFSPTKRDASPNEVTKQKYN